MEFRLELQSENFQSFQQLQRLNSILPGVKALLFYLPFRFSKIQVS